MVDVNRCVMCHVSCVMCHMSCIIYHMSCESPGVPLRRFLGVPQMRVWPRASLALERLATRSTDRTGKRGWLVEGGDGGIEKE